MRYLNYLFTSVLAVGLFACEEEAPPQVVVGFTADATTVTAGETVTFTDQSTGSPTSWAWIFPGGTPSTSQDRNPTIVYNQQGTYSVTLTAANVENEDSEIKTEYITVEAALPPVVASFTLSSDTVEVGDPVAFTSTATGNPTTLAWTFEGGSPQTSTQPEQEATYAVAGEYDITLSVSNGSDSDDIIQPIVVVPKCSLNSSSFDCAEALVFDQATEGKIDERGKQNYYIFTVPRPAVVEVLVTGIDPAISLQAAFFNEDRSQEGNPTSTSNSEFRYDVLLDSGTYYLRLDNRSSNGGSDQPYRLTVSLDSSDVNELNNDPQSATPITFVDNSSGVIKGTIRSIGDQDYYKFTLDKAVVVEVQIANIDPGIWMEIAFFNEDQTINESIGREKEVRAATIGGNELTHARLLSAGTYYLRLNDQGNNSSSAQLYELTVSIDDTDVNEINNSIEEASLVTFTNNSSGIIKGAIRSKGDQDYYQFTLDEAVVVDFQITNIDPAIWMEIALFNKDKTTNGGEIRTTTVGGGELTHARLLAAGTYYLRLNDQGNNNEGTQLYELTISLDKSDPNELNGDFINATEISIGNLVRGTIRSVGDQDFFKFTLSESATINVKIANIDSNVWMEIAFFNEDKTMNGREVRTTTIGGGELTHERLLEDGTYYLRLNDQGNNSSGTQIYELTITAN